MQDSKTLRAQDSDLLGICNGAQERLLPGWLQATGHLSTWEGLIWE